MLRSLRALPAVACLVFAFWGCASGKVAEGEAAVSGGDLSGTPAGASDGATGGEGNSATGGDSSAASAAACGTTDDCMLKQERCCQDCDATDRPFVAMTRDQYQSYRDEHCPLPKCGPPDFDPGVLECPAEHYALTAVCEAGQCKKLDLLASPFSACERDEQCQLRAGAQCCPDCSLYTPSFNDVTYYGGGLIALSDEAGLLAAHCGGTPSCRPCAPPFPNEVIARCIAGRCQVEYDGSPITYSEPAAP